MYLAVAGLKCVELMRNVSGQTHSSLPGLGSTFGIGFVSSWAFL